MGTPDHGGNLDILRRYPAPAGTVDKLQETGEDNGSESSNPSSGMAPESHGGLFEGAEDYVRRGIPTDAERAQTQAGETARQTRLFREWAAQTGRLIPPHALESLRQVSGRTSEHAVFFDPASNRAIKQTWPGQFGWVPRLEGGRWTLGVANPLDYLRRWQLFNQTFGDDVRLEGAMVSSEP